MYTAVVVIICLPVRTVRYDKLGRVIVSVGHAIPKRRNRRVFWGRFPVGLFVAVWGPHPGHGIAVAWMLVTTTLVPVKKRRRRSQDDPDRDRNDAHPQDAAQLGMSNCTLDV